MKTSDLLGAPLDWAVAKCAGLAFTKESFAEHAAYEPSTDWTQGGPIIEKAIIDILSCDGGDYWQAHIYLSDERVEEFGQTPLIAAMRCFVASKLGDEVEIPEEMK